MKLLLSSAIFLALSSNVFAFTPQMKFFVNREVATVQIMNNTNRVLVCSGVAYGTTMNRITLNAWFNNVQVTPGAFANAYVYSNYYDPFINVWANVNCQFSY